MADINFQSNNSVIILDHTKISTPTNLIVKGTNQAPERRNLLFKDLFKFSNAYKDTYIGLNFFSGYGVGHFQKRYGNIILVNNEGSNDSLYLNLRLSNIQKYLDPSTANMEYTLTFKINKVANIKGAAKTLNLLGSTSKLILTNGMKGIYSCCGKISKSSFDSNNITLFELYLNKTDSILVQNEKVIVEIELLSLELGNHTNDPILFMPESFSDNSIINNLEETPLISNSSLSTVGEYRLEGEVSLFLQQIEDLLEENYELFSPSKTEMNITYTFLRR